MLKKNSLLKRIFVVSGCLIIIIVAFGFWIMNLFPSGKADNLNKTLPEDLPYLTEKNTPFRGIILAVVTSCDKMGKSNKSTGYELTELARAYYVFSANGFEVDIASPLGGKPPVIIDWDDMGVYDYSFLNDTVAQHKVKNSIKLEKVQAADYEAVFFVGGKGAMFDFPENKKIQSIVQEYYQTGKVIGAVCHGPAALVNVTLADGSSFLENKRVSSFTNDEELFLIPEAKTIFPFLLQDKLVGLDAKFNAGEMYLENVVKDGNLVTGQNPWSTWALAEAMVQRLGYVPVMRPVTAEENTIRILQIYSTQGSLQAKQKIDTLLSDQQNSIDKTLLAMHSIVAAMQWNLGKSIDLVGLLSYIKNASVHNQ